MFYSECPVMCIELSKKQRTCKNEIASKEYTFIMELSSVFTRSYFLLEMKHASPDDRIFMLQNTTSGQLACIGEIARRIYHQTFPLLTQVMTYFDDRITITDTIFIKSISS